jgi:hypothetical protein
LAQNHTRPELDQARKCRVETEAAESTVLAQSGGTGFSAVVEETDGHNRASPA